VIGEERYTALTGHWTAETERDFLRGLGPRSEIFVAELEGHVIGFQVVEPFITYTTTMDHVAHFGTYVHAEFRGRGIGKQLATATRAFALAQGYEKAVVYVLSDNDRGLAYYRSLGFRACGVLTRQTKIGERYHDEVLMELHFGVDTNE
jgi:L-amino acid N-acyltransferase YncA